MIMENKIILSILISMNLVKLHDCDCEMWFKKLSSKDNGLIVTINWNPAKVSWTKTGTIVQDSVGPYGDIFMSLIISDNDRIACSKILKGDSVLLPKIEIFLSTQTVISAEVNGRKVYSVYAIRLQFVETSKGKVKRRKNKL